MIRAQSHASLSDLDYARSGHTGFAAASDIPSPLTIQEIDGTPTGTPTTLKVTNGCLTDNGDGSFTLAIGGGSAANPTASIGLSVVNGSAATFMRSDAAPPLDVGIIPTWTGAHTFSNGVTFNNTVTLGASASGAPVNVDLAAASEGVATTISRSDHKHDLAENIAPTWTATHTFSNRIQGNGGWETGTTPGTYNSSIANTALLCAHSFTTTTALGTYYASSSDFRYLMQIKRQTTSKFDFLANGYFRCAGIYAGATAVPVAASTNSYPNQMDGYFSDETSTQGTLKIIASTNRAASGAGAFSSLFVNASLNDATAGTTLSGTQSGLDFALGIVSPTIARTYSGAVTGAVFTMGFTTAGDYAAISVSDAYCLRPKWSDLDNGAAADKTVTLGGFISCEYSASYTNKTTFTTFNGISLPDCTQTNGTNFNAIKIAAAARTTGAAHQNINFVGGDWNTGHVQLNTGHLWATAGVMRIQGQAPTSATDGSIHVGINAISFLDVTTPIAQPASTTDLLDSLQALGLIDAAAGDTPLNLTNGPVTCGSLTATGTVKLGGDGSSHYVGIDTTDGHLTLVGNAIAYDDLRVAGEHVKAGATAPTWGAFTGGLKLWFFGAGTEDEVHFSIQMPHNWKAGTAVSPHVHWIAPSDSDEDPEGQAVRWGLEYTWANITTVFPATSTIYALTDDTIVANTHYITYFADITPGADQDEMSSMLICRLFRNGGNGADTYEASAGLLEFDLHYQIDSFGSNTATSKT